MIDDLSCSLSFFFVIEVNNKKFSLQSYKKATVQHARHTHTVPAAFRMNGGCGAATDKQHTQTHRGAVDATASGAQGGGWGERGKKI